MWSAIAFYWEATGAAVANVTNEHAMLPIAYSGATLMMTYGHDIAERDRSRRTNQRSKLVVETLYIGVSSVFGVMLWIGRRRTRCRVLLRKGRIPRHRCRLARHAYILTSDTRARFPREDPRERVGVGVVECGLNRTE